MILESMKAAQPGSTIWDRNEKQSVNGLHLRCFPLKKVFYLFYRTRTGVQRRPKIGVFGQITLSQARSIAKGILDQVARGDDPQKDWHMLRGEPTVRELFAFVLKEHWDTERFQKSGRSKEAQSLFNLHIEPTLGAMKISEITVKTARAWHKSFSKIKPTGNRALEILSTMFNFAESEEISKMANPCKHVKPYPEQKRTRYATPEEIKAISERLEFYFDEWPKHSMFIYLILYTGCRPSTLQRAKWSDLRRTIVDGEEFGIITFDGKSTADSGAKEIVVIPPRAMLKLDSLPKEGDRIVNVNWVHGLWDKIIADLGIEDLWVRDLRRTFATVGFSSGQSLDAIGEILNHQSTQTTKIYAKLMDESKIKSVRSIANSINEMSKPDLKLVQ